MGGKARVAKPLAEFLNAQLTDNSVFVDAFCGSCNVLTKIREDVIRIGNDKHRYVSAMWDAVVCHGWIPPKDVTEERYKELKNNLVDAIDAEKGFVGFRCSFSGKWWGGYCRYNTGRNYALNAHNSVMKKASNLKDVTFYNLDYSELLQNLPSYSNMVICCDIPYKNTTPYCKNEVGVFDHEKFYEWAKETTAKGHKVFVSEYLQNVPEDAIIVWQHNSKKDIRDKQGIQQPTTEVVFTYV